MSTDARQASALAALHQQMDAANHRVHAQHACFFKEKPFLEVAILRGDARSPQVAGAIAHTLDLELPRTPNTVTSGPTHDALWLGPDEWLLQSAEPREPLLERTLRPLLAGQFATVVDVSGGYTVLELSGSRAREVLQKGCPLDLHPRLFTVGQCAQSHFFKAAIVIRPIAPDVYELVLRRSYADYAARMLLDAAA